MDGRFLYIPHSVTFSKAQNRLFVADRENGRIVSYDPLTSNGKPEVFAKGLTANGKWGSLYAISFNGTGGWPLYAIGGPMKEDGKYWGHVVSRSGESSTAWGPSMVRVAAVASVCVLAMKSSIPPGPHPPPPTLLSPSSVGILPPS